MYWPLSIIDQEMLKAGKTTVHRPLQHMPCLVRGCHRELDLPSSSQIQETIQEHKYEHTSLDIFKISIQRLYRFIARRSHPLLRPSQNGLAKTNPADALGVHRKDFIDTQLTKEYLTGPGTSP